MIDPLKQHMRYREAAIHAAIRDAMRVPPVRPTMIQPLPLDPPVERLRLWCAGVVEVHKRIGPLEAR